MPYLKRKRRPNIFKKYDDDSIQIDGHVVFADSVENGGDLQYAIAEIINLMLKKLPDNYASKEMIMGALSGADKEFYRKVVAPYEDKKIEENGAVYD